MKYTAILFAVLLSAATAHAAECPRAGARPPVVLPLVENAPVARIVVTGHRSAPLAQRKTATPLARLPREELRRS